jgi:hypothetical protein
MTDNMEIILKQINQKIADGKPISAVKLVKYCNKIGVNIAILYQKLHKQRKLKYLK